MGASVYRTTPQLAELSRPERRERETEKKEEMRGEGEKGEGEMRKVSLFRCRQWLLPIVDFLPVSCGKWKANHVGSSEGASLTVASSEF